MYKHFNVLKMKKYLSLLLVLVIVSCNMSDSNTASEDMNYDITGNWQFLNKSGVYTESFFDTSYFRVFNLYLGISPDFKYYIDGDSLFTTFKSTKKVKPQMSIFSWINEDKVILETRTGADTMERIKDGKHLLETTNPLKDSIVFMQAFIKRNDDYLINRGILTREEVDAFRQNKTIPDDVQEKMNEKK